jgi:Na+-driven multidrug efflux pump
LKRLWARIAYGSGYLRAVGPFYGFYGLGFALYFASQGAGRLLWPLLAGMFRLLIATGGGWLALQLTGSLAWLFALALGLLVYGVMIPAGNHSRRLVLESDSKDSCLTPIETH